MKKFGLPTLLSAGYVGLLCLIFSTDFAKDNTFLKNDLEGNQPGRAISTKVASEIPSVKTRILTYDANSVQPTHAGNSDGMQSAEGAVAGN